MTKKHKRIELASQTRLKKVEELAPRFFREVLGMNYSDCLITDESDLGDFLEQGHSLEEFFERLEHHYFIDGRDAGTTRIVALLEFLNKRGVTG